MLQFTLAEDDRNKVVSALTQIEAQSTIYRLRKGRRLTGEEASIALAGITAETRRMVEQPISPPVLSVASLIVGRHSLRGMDSIQLASAVVARDLLAAPEMRFISSDVDLLAAAKAEGFDIWDPTT